MSNSKQITSFTGAEIRQSFIDYFKERGHTYVRSSSLVPGGDQTLLFTNAGMVQFKDVFLGEDKRPYKRAVNSQKCMRVAGKHNDLEDVGRDDSHHTFFEMLGNWSFGDYYKEEAITWAWDLLTNVWGLEKSRLWATCFKDEKGDIPTDEEAANYWRKQPGIDQAHIIYFGRKENFWEMADTGPCGPCSEIHIDLGEDFCNLKNEKGHECRVNGDCKRYLELWNLVFMQYNRKSPVDLEPLPSCHVDTGMGLERVVAIIQQVYSNYKTDLLLSLIKTVQQLTGQSDEERDANLTPYRVIADHGRAAAFLIADGIVPGNTGRNYVCRMIIRRAARFGSKIGLNNLFLAKVAERVIDDYSGAFPELKQNRKTIIENLNREEERFQRTVDSGISFLNDLLTDLKKQGGKVLSGEHAFDLYATHGLPLEITRDVAQEQGMDVDEIGFQKAMEDHRLISGAGKTFGPLGGEDVEIYRNIFDELVEQGKLRTQGVEYNPYDNLEIKGNILSLVCDGFRRESVKSGEKVEVVLPKTCFYIESGGQVSDTGSIISLGKLPWEIKVEEMRKPATGIITYLGKVVAGEPRVDDFAIAKVDKRRRRDIVRNHTATHLLHAELRAVLGEHARQAGSLVAPDHLRFDFTQPKALTEEELERVERGVNEAILENYSVNISTKQLSDALAQGAMALFGEKYGEVVRTITIGEGQPYSYELCGGTHVHQTGDIGQFIITSESSAAAGVRRIEAITGHYAYELVQQRFHTLNLSANILGSTVDDLPKKINAVIDDLTHFRKQEQKLRQEIVKVEINKLMQNVPVINGINVLASVIKNADADILRQMTDNFRNKYPSGCVVLGSEVDGRPLIIASVTDDLIKRGLNAGNIVREIAKILGGSGGGKPNLAQAGGKDASKLGEAIEQVIPLIKKVIKE